MNGKDAPDRPPRRQNRKDIPEIILQPVSLAPGEIGDLEDDDADGREFAAAMPPRLLRGDERGDALLLSSCSAGVRPHRRPPRRLEHLADEARDAHHEKFVEVVGGDREKPKPLEKGWLGLADSSSTRWLNSSHDNSRLMNRSGEDNSGGGSSFVAIVAIVEYCCSFVATRRIKQISFPSAPY